MMAEMSAGVRWTSTTADNRHIRASAVADTAAEEKEDRTTEDDAASATTDVAGHAGDGHGCNATK